MKQEQDKPTQDMLRFLKFMEDANCGMELRTATHEELIEAWEQARKDMGFDEGSFDWAGSCEEHDEILRNLERDDESDNSQY